MSESRTFFGIGSLVYIPTSHLGRKYGAGEILGMFGETIVVDFSGHLGHYTISNHEIIPASIGGMKVVIDDTIPIDEIHIKFNN